MIDLPAPVRDFIAALTEGTLPPAYLLVTEEGELSEWGGDLGSYGITGLKKNVQIRERLAFLGGVLPLDRETVFLPHIQTNDGIFADIHLFRRDGGTWFVFLDATAEVEKRQGAQQRTHVLRQSQLAALHQQSRELTARLRTSQEEERTRIAREIHDELGQMLTAIKMDLRWLAKHLGPIDEAALLLSSDKLTDTTELVDLAIKSVQKIATELRPPLLDNLGLVASIEHEAGLFERRSGIPCKVSSATNIPELVPDVSIAFFRIFQEILTNVARHAGATRITARLVADPEWLTLVVADDGRGISAAQLEDMHSLGLLGMRERASLLGGQVTITGAPAAGTTVTARISLSGHRP